MLFKTTHQRSSGVNLLGHDASRRTVYRISEHVMRGGERHLMRLPEAGEAAVITSAGSIIGYKINRSLNDPPIIRKFFDYIMCIVLYNCMK